MGLEKIAKIIHENNKVRWRFNNELRKPTEQEVYNILVKMYRELDDEESITLGGINMQKTAGHTDIYQFIGEVK